MHDITVIPKKPSVARRLLDFVNLGTMNVNDELLDLAKQDTVNNDYNLSETQLRGLQFIEDHNGRGIVIETENNAIRPLLIHTLSNDKFPLLILTSKPESFVSVINELMPDKKVIFGDGDGDIYIHQLNALYKTDLLRKNRFKQLILDKGISLSHGPTITNAQFACREVKSSAVIVNVKSLIKNSKDDNLSNEDILDRIAWDSYNDVYTILNEIMTSTNTSVFNNNNHERLKDHLKDCGYPIDKRKMLPLLNISTDFV